MEDRLLMALEWMWRSGAVVSAVVVALAVGCSDPEEGTVSDNQNQYGEDVGESDDAGLDDAGIDDTGPDPEVGPDADAGGDADVAPDADDDTDVEDDGPVDGEGDNCPEISNPDQADRSRDGIGDACDNFPYFHDPSNPEYIEVIYEDAGPPNDGFWDGQQNWMLDLPLMLEGGIETPGDIDYYSFSIDEPTTILVHVEQLTATSDLWPVVLVMDGFLESFQFSSVVFADNQGESVVQDIHLPVAGEYHFIISDYNNLTSGGGNTGGDDYGYRISISTPPLPEAYPLSVPVPRQVESYDDRVATTYTVDVSDGDTLKVEATGAPRNQLSVLFPAIQFLDADTGDVLAYTLEDHVETDSMRNELTVKVGDVDEVLVIVESHTGIGENDLVIDVDVFDKPEHLESPEQPRHTREDYLVWMRPGSWIESMIGPPIPVADDALGPDEDFFMMMTNPGDFFRLTAEPMVEGLLVPEVTIGRFTAGGSYWTWHEGAGAWETGQTDSLSVLTTTDDHRDSVIQVVHSGNSASPLPVGGPDYGYELHVEALDWEEEAEQYEEFPASIPVELEAGQQGVYNVDFQPGYDYTINYNGSFSRQLVIADTETWEALESTSASTGYFARPGQEVVLAVRDDNGEPITEAEGISIDIAEGDGPQDVDIPEVVEGQLDDNNSLETYRATVGEGELIEVRTVSSMGTAPEVKIVGESIQVTENGDETMALAKAEADTEVIIVVERATAANVEYSVAIHSIEPSEVESPHEGIGTFEEDMGGQWWRIDVDEDQLYAINAAGESEFGNPHWLAIFDAESLELLAESDDGFSLFDGGDVESTEVLVTTADIDGPVGESTDFAVSFAPVDVQPYGGPQSLEFVSGVRPAFLEVEHEESGLSMVEINSDEEAPQVRSDIVALSSLETVASDTAQQPLAAVARSGERDFTAMIIPDAVDGEAWEVDVEISHIAIDEAQWLDADVATLSEPLDVEEWPAVYAGELADIDMYRTFSLDMEADSRLWVLAMPGENTSATSAFPHIYVINPSGFDEHWDFSSGEGNFPALQGAPLMDDGVWTVEFGTGMSNGVDSGEFVLYFLRR